MNVPNVYRIYPCCVFFDKEDFHWYHMRPWLFASGEPYPKNEDEVDMLMNCTVEVLEYPDGRYSAAWFPGEFHAETSPDAQNCP